MAQRTSHGLRHLFTNIGALLSASVITKVVSAGTTILLARQVGVAGFGEYAAAMALLRIASIAFSLGLDAWLLRNGFREGSSASLVHRTTINLLIKLLFGVLWLVLMSVVGYLVLPNIYTPALLIALALAIWMEELANTVWSAFQASVRNQTTFVLTILFHSLILIGTLLLIWRDVDTILPFALTRMVAATVGCGVALWWFSRSLGFHHLARQDVGQVKRQLHETVPFGLSAGLSLIYGRADTAIAAHYLGSEAAGLYSSAMSLMSMALLMPLAIYLVMLPILSRAHAEHSPALLGMTKRMIGWNVVVGLVLGTLLAIIAEPLMRLIYGAQYAESGTVLTIFSGVLALRFVSFALAVFITAVGWQGKRTSIQAIVAVANVGLNMWLIRYWGLSGVAVVYLLTELILMVGYLWLVLRWWYEQGSKWRAMPFS